MSLIYLCYLKPECQRQRQRQRQLQLQRLKRRKLLLKDQISWLERQVDPDIPA